MAQDLFQILDGIQISDEELREAEIFSVEYLQPLYPDLDLREGTALRDTGIRAAATLLAMARKGINYYFTINSLDNATDQTPEETVDSIVSNFFLARKTGTNSVISTRLYFASKKNVTIGTSLFFSPDNESFFFPVETVSVTADNLEYDANKGLWYVDVDMESESSGDQYNINSGELLFFSTFDPFFVGGDILFLKERSIPRESNTDFIDRVGPSISTRNLINAPSIESRITETFNLFSSITSVGMGEDEMLRDLVTAYVGIPPQFESIHIGGHVDVYVVSQIETSEVQLELDANTNTFILDGDYSGVFDIRRVAGNGDTIPVDTEAPVLGFGGETTTVRYSVSVENYNTLGEPIEPRYDLGLSSRQVTVISLLDAEGNPNPYFPGGLATFSFKQATGLNSLQSFFDDSLQRVVNADLLARSYEIYSLDINITTHGVTDATAFQADEYARNYVNSIEPGAPFVMSELMEVLARDAGIDNMVTPLNVQYTLTKKSMRTEIGTITSILDPTRLRRFIVNRVSLNGETV